MRDNAVYDDVIQFAANLERALLVDMLGKFLAICDEQRDTLVAHVVSSLRSPIPPPPSSTLETQLCPLEGRYVRQLRADTSRSGFLS